MFLYLFVRLFCFVLFFFFCGGGGGKGVKAGQLLSREAHDTSIFSANLAPRRCDPFVRYQV